MQKSLVYKSIFEKFNSDKSLQLFFRFWSVNESIVKVFHYSFQSVPARTFLFPRRPMFLTESGSFGIDMTNGPKRLQNHVQASKTKEKLWVFLVYRHKIFHHFCKGAKILKCFVINFFKNRPKIWLRLGILKFFQLLKNLK